MRCINKSGKEPNYLLTFRRTPFTEGIGLKTRESKYSDFQNSPYFDRFREELLNSQGHLCAFCMKRIPEYNQKGEQPLQNMKVAHWYPQNGENTANDRLDLTYINMYGVCTGNTKIRSDLNQNAVIGSERLTCDTKQEDNFLTINPREQRHIDFLQYNSDGEIFCLELPGNSEEERREILKQEYHKLMKNKGITDLGVNGRSKKRLDWLRLTPGELQLAIQYDIEFNLNLNHFNLKERRANAYQQAYESYRKFSHTSRKGTYPDKKAKKIEARRLMSYWLDEESKGNYRQFCMAAVAALKKYW